MSQENVEVVRRGWDAYARGDISAMLDVFAEDVVTVRPEPPARGRFEGREGVLESLFSWAEDFDEFNQTPLELIDAGDRVITHVLQKAHGAQSGVPVTADFWFVFTLRDRRVVKLEMFASKTLALEAAGVSE
jgi:ketosteroid isomerase-like protein